MYIKWYFLAELLGLVKDISDTSPEYTYSVSGKTDTVFFILSIVFLAIMLAIGFILRYSLPAGKSKTGKVINIILISFFAIYSISSFIGFGPYIVFYPGAGGFLNLDRIIWGVYLGLISLLILFGWLIGARLEKNKVHKNLDRAKK